MAQICRTAEEIHEPVESVNVIEAGPTDNRILECALATNAELLVTGDKKHLLPLGSFQGVSILGFGTFWHPSLLTESPLPDDLNRVARDLRVGAQHGHLLQ